MLGMAILPFDQTDGMIILTEAEKLGKSLNEVAKHNKQIRDVLVRLTQISVYGVFISLHASVVIAIMQNHDILPSLPFQQNNDNLIDLEQKRHERKDTIPDIS